MSSQVVGGPPSAFTAERTRIVWYLSPESTAFPEKPWALCNELVIRIFFGETILFSISFILMKNTYTKYFFLFQTTYSAFIQLLPVLVIVIISVITQLLAANPPYSLFYKS